ncbi:MAG: sulfotransferase family protein [Streptosporangiaceae bacterium]
MTLRVVGAGLARTGTASLKIALEQLLGGPVYHMFELFARPQHIPAWHQAARGQLPSWDQLLDGYQAAVDLPAAAFWQELATASPDALIILSVRDSAGQWWDSASQTVFNPSRPAPAAGTPQAGFADMITEVLRARLGMTDLSDKNAMIPAYERHNSAVRALAPPGRMLEWRPEDGWGPLASALGRPVPDLPFPKVNTRSQFKDPELGKRMDLSATPSPRKPA